MAAMKVAALQYDVYWVKRHPAQIRRCGSEVHAVVPDRQTAGSPVRTTSGRSCWTGPAGCHKVGGRVADGRDGAGKKPSCTIIALPHSVRDDPHVEPQLNLLSQLNLTIISTCELQDYPTARRPCGTRTISSIDFARQLQDHAFSRVGSVRPFTESHPPTAGAQPRLDHFHFRQVEAGQLVIQGVIGLLSGSTHTVDPLWSCSRAPIQVSHTPHPSKSCTPPLVPHLVPAPPLP